ncbi:MAG TPA: PAS domain-containing sensor histidine kinase [Gammaproteobacteria bacterium]
MKGRSAVGGYAIALAAAAGAALCAAWPLPVELALLALVVPVVLAAFAGGIAPGIATTVLTAAAVVAMRLARGGDTWPGGEGAALGLFVVQGFAASWLVNVARRSRAEAHEDRCGVEEALRQSEARYRAIVDTQAEMVCRFRLDGRILFVNGGYARARGTAPETLVGRSFWDFIADEDRPGVRALLEQLSPDAPEIRIENRFETADGVRWTLWTNRALAFDASGRCIEAQSTGIDITERKEAEEALRESNRRKSEFLAVLGHELRNPLAPLSAGVELLQQPTIGFESIVKVRAMMKRQLDHLSRLVEDLLDLSRISRGEVVLRKAPLDMRDVVDAAVELCMPAIVQREHRLIVDTGRAPLPADGDFQRLTQVIGNLLSNAAKYTEPGGSITVTAAVEDDNVAVRVRDTGFGLPAECLDSLFDMFTQVAEHRERTAGGLGIGLALSRQLVARHGGSIEARSDGPGLGSEFIVRLPLGWEAPGAEKGVRHLFSSRTSPFVGSPTEKGV